MGIILIPIMLGILILGFIPTLVFVSRLKRLFPWYFKSKTQLAIHWVIVFVVTYLGFQYGWELVNLNLPSANEGFGHERSSMLFVAGLVLPGVFCLLTNVLLLALGRLYFNIASK